MSDLISRQAAIDALDKHCDYVCEYTPQQRAVMCGACSLGGAFDVIDELPSAQPEIIRCKDCKHWDELLAMCKKSRRVIFGVNDFCSYAERRTDETDYRKE